MKKKITIIGIIALIILTILIIYSKYKKPIFNLENSPKIKAYDVYGENDGSENGQSVNVILEYDKDIHIKDDLKKDIKIKIADNKVNDKNYIVKKLKDNKKIQLVIETTAVTSGKLTIDPLKDNKEIKSITSLDKKYASQAPKIDCLIPSGVTLKTLSQTTDDGENMASVEKEVSSTYNIRSIAWIMFLKNGEVVPVIEEDSAETLDGGFALHGHDFLHETPETIAEGIGELLEKYYGRDYSISLEKEKIKIQAKSQAVGDQIDLVVYEY